MIKIKQAAIRFEDGTIITRPRPARHPTLLLDAEAKGLHGAQAKQGFLTTEDVFVSRESALKIAVLAGQRRVKMTAKKLYTEDLW